MLGSLQFAAQCISPEGLLCIPWCDAQAVMERYTSSYVATASLNTTSNAYDTNTQERDPPNTQVQSIDIDFIGTCAMVPSKTRNTSSLRVQIQGRSWIFDAGENTQVNFQKFGVSPQKIDKIFITHTWRSYSWSPWYFDGH